MATMRQTRGYDISKHRPLASFVVIARTMHMEVLMFMLAESVTFVFSCVCVLDVENAV